MDDYAWEYVQKKYNHATVYDLSRSLDGIDYVTIAVPDKFKTQVNFALKCLSRAKRLSSPSSYQSPSKKTVDQEVSASDLEEDSVCEPCFSR